MPRGHYPRKRGLKHNIPIKDPQERFWKKVMKEEAGCWIWQGSLSSAGYGIFNLGRRGTGYDSAHRLSFQWAGNSITEGYDLDHLCRNRACINPAHLEAVPHRINVLRGAHPLVAIHHSGACHNGHEINDKNTYFHKNNPNHWNCRVCRRERRRKETMHVLV